MDVHQATPEIVQWLCGALRAERTLTAPQRRFLLSTFGSLDLSDFLSANQGCDIETFLELVFYPDQSMRLHFETHWGAERFAARDVQAIITGLQRQVVHAGIMAEPRSPVQRVDLPPALLASIVDRLRMQWRPPPEIEAGLQQVRSCGRRVSLRVALRQAPLVWHSGQVALISRFLQVVDPGHESFDLLFAELLDLSGDMPANQSTEAFFQSRKSSFLQNLRNAREFERRQRMLSMEILMMQGDRAIYGNAAHWLSRLSQIDRLSIALSGQVPLNGIYKPA